MPAHERLGGIEGRAQSSEGHTRHIGPTAIRNCETAGAPTVRRPSLVVVTDIEPEKKPRQHSVGSVEQHVIVRTRIESEASLDTAAPPVRLGVSHQGQDASNTEESQRGSIDAVKFGLFLALHPASAILVLVGMLARNLLRESASQSGCASEDRSSSAPGAATVNVESYAEDILSPDEALARLGFDLARLAIANGRRGIERQSRNR